MVRIRTPSEVRAGDANDLTVSLGAPDPPRRGGLGGCGCLNRISASISGASAGVGRRAEGQRGEVGLIGRASVKARMRPMAVVEVDVAAERSSRLIYAVIGPQIHLLVFDTAPEALEEHVIAPRAPAVHADRNLVLEQDVG